MFPLIPPVYKYGAIALLAVGLVIWAGMKIDNYGDQRYEQGKKDETGIWTQLMQKQQERNSVKEQTWQREKEELSAEVASNAAGLQSHYDDLVRTHAADGIRLCKQRSERGSDRGSTASSTTNSADALSERGESALSAGEDIGQTLLVFGRDAEACRQQVIGLQSFIQILFPPSAGVVL